MQIAIIGAGHVGETLATMLTRAGYAVKVANSRGPASLSDFARRTGAAVVDLSTISAGTDVLIIAIPLCKIPGIPASVIADLPLDAVVVDANNYYPARDGRLQAIDEGQNESAWVSEQLGKPVVKAFNNIIAGRLGNQGRPRGNAGRIALPVAGDDAAARKVVMEIVESIGFDAYDAGGIDASWHQQPGTPAYCTDPNLAELPRLLARADRLAATRNRDQGARLMAKLPADYPAEELVRVARFFVGLDKWRVQSWVSVLRLMTVALRGPTRPGRVSAVSSR